MPNIRHFNDMLFAPVTNGWVQSGPTDFTVYVDGQPVDRAKSVSDASDRFHRMASLACHFRPVKPHPEPGDLA